MTRNFTITPGVEEVNRRGAIARQASKEVSAKIRDLVEQLKVDYEGQEAVIMRALDGEFQRLLSEKEVAKRQARNKSIKGGS